MDNARMQQIKAMLLNEPDDSFLNYALAMEFVGQGNDDKAISLLEKILALDPDYTATYYHLAQAYLRNNRKPEALDLLKTGMTIATRKQERHALAELQTAYNEILFEDD